MAEIRKFQLSDYTAQIVVIVVSAVVGMIFTFVDLGVDKQALIDGLVIIVLAILGNITVRKSFAITAVYPHAIVDYTAEIVTIVVTAIVGVLVLFVPAAEPYREVLITALVKLVAFILGSIGVFKAFLHRS